MESTAALAAGLATLTQALDDPAADIAAALAKLAADAAAAIPSFLGLSVTAGLYSFVSLDGGAPARIGTSLLIPSSHLAGGSGLDAVSIVLYAAQPGAFVDLAADLGWLAKGLPALLIDAHLSPPAHSWARIAHASTVDQAIGVLIEQGRTPEEAHLELAERATRDGVERHVAAGDLLAELEGEAS